MNDTLPFRKNVPENKCTREEVFFIKWMPVLVHSMAAQKRRMLIMMPKGTKRD